MSDFMQQESFLPGISVHTLIVGAVILVLAAGVAVFVLALRRNGGTARFTIYDMTVVGVMAAVVFVVTYFIKIPVPTPAGQVMIKLANAFCLLAGVLFGGLRGGLAAGIGSMFYDLLDPVYITDAPLTLVRFFLMAFVCGLICWGGKERKLTLPRMILGTSAGSLFSLVFYFVQSVIKQLLLGQPFDVAFLQCIPKMTVSGINAVVAVIVACLLAPLCRKGLEQARLYQKLSITR